MAKLHIKKGDTVMVLTGNSKGKTGTVLRVLVKEQKAIVEGLNMVSKSQKPSASEAGSPHPHLQPQRCGSQDRKGNPHWS